MPKDPEVVQKFETAGVEPLSMTETEFAELVRKDRRLWHPLIRDLNLSAE
jgi:tripartite-type tricarboxylate transporter receptor subunit TctC